MQYVVVPIVPYADRLSFDADHISFLVSQFFPVAGSMCFNCITSYL